MTDYKEILEALRDEDNCNVLDWIDDAADAIEELLSENERLKYTIIGVMHSVDKWLGDEELNAKEIQRAATDNITQDEINIIKAKTEEEVYMTEDIMEKPSADRSGKDREQYSC